MKTQLSIFALSLLLLLFSSCLNTKIYEGKALIVSRSFDTSLQDSAMIYGYVLDAAEKQPLWNSSTIIVEETQTTTYSDSTGYFSMKLLQGTYTVVCFDPLVTNDTLKLENTVIFPNEKVEIKFLKGVVIW